jgi:hypothetical protein
MSAGGVSATAGAICLGIALILYFFADRWQPRLIVLLVLGGMTGITGSALDTGLRHGVTRADDIAGRFIGQMTGAALTGAVAFVAVVAVVIAFWKNHVSGAVLLAAMVAPGAAALIPGQVGDVSATVINTAGGFVGGAIGALFGV